MKIKTTILLSIVAIVLMLVILDWKYPSKWKSIHKGDTADDVKSKCKTIQTDLQDIKGDFCYSSGLLHHWTLNVLYGLDNRVRETDLTLTIGTKNIYKTLNFGSIESE